MGLSGVAEPDAVAGADLAVSGQVDGDGLADAVAGGAPVAGGGGPDGAVPAGGGEGGERAGEAVGICAGEAGERVQGLGGCGDERVVLGAVVAVAGLGGEPGGQDGEYLGDGEVAGAGQAGQVGDECLPGDRGDGPWQCRRVSGPGGWRAGYAGQVRRRILLCGRLPAAGRQPVPGQLVVEGGAACLEAELSQFLEQGGGPQMGVLGETLPAVAGEGVGEQARPGRPGFRVWCVRSGSRGWWARCSRVARRWRAPAIRPRPG